MSRTEIVVQRARPGTALVSLIGEHDAYTSTKLSDELAALLAEGLDVIVDLREATVRGEQLSIQATALVGDVFVLVPPGATVEMSGVAVLGHKKVAVEPAEYTLAVPVVRVSAVTILGDVIVATQLPKSRIKSAWARWKNRKSVDSI